MSSIFIFESLVNCLPLFMSVNGIHTFKRKIFDREKTKCDLPCGSVFPVSASSSLLVTPTTAIMPSEDKPPQQTRQRKKNKQSCSKGKSLGGLGSARPGGTINGQDVLLTPPVLQPPLEKLAEEKFLKNVPVAKVEEESSIVICLQVLFPYLLAGMGMVMAGMVLDYVQVSVSWKTGSKTLSTTSENFRVYL